jgi:hypothetical protein
MSDIACLDPEISVLGGDWFWLCAAFATMKFRIFAYWIAQSPCESQSRNEAGSGRLGLGRSPVCVDNNWLGSFPELPEITGAEGMRCPEKRLFASTDYPSEGFTPVWRLVACRVYGSRVFQLVRHGRQNARYRRRRISGRVVCPGVIPSKPPIPRGLRAPLLPSQLLRVSALRRSSRATTSAVRALLGGSGPLTLTPERVSNVQQNAHRRVASRRNPGSRRSW